MIPKMNKKAGHLLWPCAFIDARFVGSPANLAFLLILIKIFSNKIPGKRFMNAGREKASVVPVLE